MSLPFSEVETVKGTQEAQKEATESTDGLSLGKVSNW
jgi:hypothetical protein